MLVFKNIVTVAFLSVFLINCGSSNTTDDVVSKDDVPTAKNDILIVEENSTAGTINQIDVTKNDSLGNDGGGTDNFSIVTTTTYGSLTEISDGIFEYIPNADYYGDDSFTYQLSDKDGDKATATVSITVNKFVPSASDFQNIDPNFPSFTSIEDTTPEDKKWVKLESMSDEFDSWDGSKWFKSTWNYGVPVFMSKSAENSGVTDGKLWIKATLNESNAEGRWFQTARIHSKAETKYPMYTEARIKTSHISAYTTYWLNNGDSYNRDEIDIIENNSNPSCTNCEAEIFPLQMNSQYFHADSNLNPVVIRNHGKSLRSDLSPTNPLIDKGWNEAYHTYGVWWKDEKNIQFYLNGEPAGSVVVGEDKSGQTYESRVFTRDLEIIFDLWTSEDGWLGGLPEKTDLNNDAINTMKVDWVRTWKLEDK